MATARSVENACRSRRLAGTTSMPAGQRFRTAASAAVLLELEARDEAEDVVSLLLLVEPVLVSVVRHGLLLIGLEIARVGLLDDLVPGRRREPAVLAGHLSGHQVEELVLRGDVGDRPAREPAQVATLVLGRGVLGVLLRDLSEVGAGVERLADVGDFLQLIAECLEVASSRARSRDLDLRGVHLRGRRDDALLLPLRELVTQDVVLDVPLDVGFGEAAREPPLHDVVLRRPAALLHLDDVIAEVGLHRVRDLPDRESPCGILEWLHELTLSDPAELTAGLGRTGILRLVLRELIPEVLVARVLSQLVADRDRLRERVRVFDCLVGSVLVDGDEDVAAAELAEIIRVARVDRVGCHRDRICPRLLVEERVLLERVERASVVRRLLLGDLRIVLVRWRDAELNVEARELVVALGFPIAHRDDPAVQTHRRLEVVLVVLVARRPTDQSQDEEEHGREDGHDDRLLTALPLPTRGALPAGETWKWDPTSHLET